MKMQDMTTKEREMYLWKPILKILQEAGGSLRRPEIKSKLCEVDDDLAYYYQEIRTSEKGNVYRPFNWDFNFAIKQLSIIGYLEYFKGSAITLTDKGLEIDVDSLNVNELVCVVEESYKRHGTNDVNELEDSTELADISLKEEDVIDDFKTQLAVAISNMSPKKFEAFSRQLLTKMGVEFTEKGVQVSNDGGIDGYGYHTDINDFRTTRVVIQCKRYNTSSVSEPEINQFLGAMNKNQADYGVFITNGGFTNSARNAAREGSPITLIDGNDLIELVIKYQLHITPVTTYVLDDFYNE